MNKRTKYTKVVEKKHKIFESAKVQKIEASNGTFFLEEGDKFQLIPVKYLKEQSVESQAIADTIVNKINANLKDEPIEVKVVSDDSETLNGVKTTNITFEICVKEDMQSDMVKMGAEGLDFTEELDAMLNEVIAGEGFKADEVTSDSANNTFTINKIEVEGVEEEPTTYVGIDLSSNDDMVVEEDDFTVDTYEDDYVEEDIYYESATKKSKYTKIILSEKAKKEKAKKEEAEEDEDSDEDDEKETKEEKKKVKESWKSSDDRFKHYL